MAGVTKKVNFELHLIWLVAITLDGEAQSLAHSQSMVWKQWYQHHLGD